MKENQYFVDLREKFDNMEKHISEIKEMVTKVRTSLNELSTDLANGRVTTIEEAKKRVDSIRKFGTEIPPKGCEDPYGKEKVIEDPEVTCKFVSEGQLTVPIAVAFDLDSPLKKKLSEEGVIDIIDTIKWFISHIIPVTLVIMRDSGKNTTYKKAILTNIIRDPATGEYDIIFQAEKNYDIAIGPCGCCEVKEV